MKFYCSLKEWIRCGGKFILCAEGGCAQDMLQIMTKKNWHFCGDYYRRCKHSLNMTECCFPLNEDDTRFPNKYSMKATMLSGVDRANQLYSPKPDTVCISAIPGFGNLPVLPFRTPTAVMNIEKGWLLYVGDANCEDQTAEIILQF